MTTRTCILIALVLLAVGSPAVAVTGFNDPDVLPPIVMGQAYDYRFHPVGVVGSIVCSTGDAVIGVSADCHAVSGSTPGTYTLYVSAYDRGDGSYADGLFSVTVYSPVLITPSTLPHATVGQPYSQTVAVSGGLAPYQVSQSGALPAGLTFNASTGAISGTPTAGGVYNFTISATDTSIPQSASRTLTITVDAPLAITTKALPTGIVSAQYSQTLVGTAGTTPYAWTLASGTLPPGLSLASNTGTISGLPTTAGTFSFIAQILDSSNPAQTATQALSLTIAPPLSITTTSFPSAVVSSSYTQPVVAAGGTSPYLWSVASGTLPPGLALASNGAITGTPTTTGTSTFTLNVVDSTTPTAQTATQSYSLSVGSALSIQTTAVPAATVGTPYSQALLAAGGTTPYKWSLDSGPLPAGLTLGANGTITGTPTAAGLATLLVRVTDSTGPTAQTATQNLTLYVAQPLVIDTTTLPDGTSSYPYAQPLNVHNGQHPYLWTLASGTLPPGLELLASGAIIGTPSAPGNYTFTLQVADSSIPTSMQATQPDTLHISSAFTITTTTLPGGSTGIPYTASIRATDGVQPYTFALVFGTLPPGIVLNPDGSIGGTPTAPGVYNLLIRATDSTAPAPELSERALVIPIDSNLSIITPSLPDGTEGIAYNETLTAINGTQPYTWTVATGALPPGLTLLQNGAILGTPTTDGTFKFTIQATDSTHPTAAISSRAYTVKIALPLIVTTDTLPNGLIDAPYTGVLTTVGGIQPYTYTVLSGTLPPGLTLAPIGVVSGSPTTAGKYTFTISVSDSGVTPAAATKTFTIAINQPLVSSETTLPNAVVGSLYTHQLAAAGGLTPYTWSLSAGTLPSGLSLLSPGVIIGTPIRTGSSELTFVVTDTTSPTPQTTTVETTLDVVAQLALPAQTVNPVPPNVAYSTSLSATGGVQPYTWTVSAGSLPAGLSIANNGTISGTTSATGSYPVTITVSDSAEPPQHASREFILLVASPFAITTTSPMVPAVAGLPYSQPLSFSGATTPVACSISSGALPLGITLTTTGALYGQPSTVTTAQFIVTCKDAAGQTATRALTLPVQEALSIVSGTVPPIITNTPYFHVFQRSGGTGPFIWTITAGSLPGGLTLTTDGLLTGTAVTPGPCPITLTVTDSSQPTPQTASLPIPLTITTALSGINQRFAGFAGTPFNQALIAAGGTAPFVWSLASGPLPPGLTLTKTGLISGTPTTAGAFGAVANVTDANAQIASAYITFTISDPLAIPLPDLPSGTVGVPYSAMLYATGGTQPYLWSVTTGSLPPGLSLAVSGGLTGVPTAEGQFKFTVTLRTGDLTTATRQYSLTVAKASTLSIRDAAAALAPATVGVLYHATLAAAGAQNPVKWSLDKGSILPPGIALDLSGSLSGTPTAAGTSTFRLTVTDAAGHTASSSFVLTVSPNIAITTTALPEATAGTSYAATLTATGGTGAYRWTFANLPAGMFFSTTGVISGVPTAVGQFTITATVTDNGPTPLTTTKTVPLTVGATLTITTATLPTAVLNSSYSFTLTAANGTTPYTWSLANGSLAPGLSLNPAGTISGVPSKAGTFVALIKVVDAAGHTATHDELLTVSDALTITTDTVSPLALKAVASVQFAAAGGAQPYTWSLSTGTLPDGLVLTPSGALTGTPTTTGSSTVTITVLDKQHRSANRQFLIKVQASIAAFQLTPDGVTLDPASQTPVSLTLVTAAPVDLTGHLELTGNDDEDLAFMLPGAHPARSIPFRVRAGAKTAEFSSSAPALQAGTVASEITITATIGDQLSIAHNRVLPTTPTITSAHYEPGNGGFTLVIDGYSTTREMKSATFRFYTATDSAPPALIDVTQVFTAWYSSPTSRGSGIFSYRQPFHLTGDLTSSALTYVEVSLTNSIGTSSIQQIIVDK